MKYMPNISSTITKSCDKFWQHANYLPLESVLAYWCGTTPEQLSSLPFETSCVEAKRQALLTALDDDLINWRRSDGKDFEDSVYTLYKRQTLLIERDSFDYWRLSLEPEELTNEPDKHHHTPHPILDEPSTKSRNAYLTVISALTAALVDDLECKPNSDAKKIMQKLSTKGIDMPVSDKTLSNYLKDAYARGYYFK